MSEGNYHIIDSIPSRTEIIIETVYAFRTRAAGRIRYIKLVSFRCTFNKGAGSEGEKFSIKKSGRVWKEK